LTTGSMVGKSVEGMSYLPVTRSRPWPHPVSANSHHRDQPPYRLANPLPYPLFRSESGTPGALRLPGLRRPRGMGLETGVDLEALAETGRWLAALLGRPTGSKVGKALAREYTWP